MFEGVKTNVTQLMNILQHPAFEANEVYTKFMAEYAADINSTKTKKKKKKKEKKKAAEPEGPPTMIEIVSPFPGQVAEIKVAVGDKITPDQTVAVVSAMKMLNDIPSPGVGTVKEIKIKVEEQIKDEGQCLIVFEGHLMAAEEDDDDDDEENTSRAAPAASGGGDSAYVSQAWASDVNVYGQYGRSVPKIKSKLKKDKVYEARTEHNLGLAAELQERLDLVAQGGGGKYVKLHRKRGKMLARERIAAIIDPGSRS